MAVKPLHDLQKCGHLNFFSGLKALSDFMGFGAKRNT
jgi:hypothetical protein